MISKQIRLGVATLLFAGLSSAGTIFTDGFESNAVGGNTTLNGWTLVRPSVDVIAHGSSFKCATGNRCVDLDGTATPGSAGYIETTSSFTFSAGLTYTMTFWLSENQRGFFGPDTVTACLGSSVCSNYTLPAQTLTNSHFAQYTLVFAGDGSTGKLSFNHAGGDNVGIILDDVQLSDNSVPEPGTFVLIGTALAFVGLRRRS